MMADSAHIIYKFLLKNHTFLVLNHQNTIWGLQLCDWEAKKMNVLLLLLKPSSRVVIHLFQTQKDSVLPTQVSTPFILQITAGCKHAVSGILELLITCTIIMMR